MPRVSDSIRLHATTGTGARHGAARDRTSAPVAEMSNGSPDVQAEAVRPVAAQRGLTVEATIWIGLLLAAAVTRFWDLGARTLHHDESIHTWYSWLFATGDTPYVHNPLSHGPFLFHANALVYTLFGTSDATSRLMPALAGVLLVGAPWLLRGRRFLGPWGAIVASVLLLISPSFLYYTRYIRHDPYTCLGALVLCIAIFRYLEEPRRRWMVTAFISVAFLLTNHEIVFAIVLGFVIVLWGTLLWGRFRPLVPFHLAAAGLFVATLAARSVFDWAPLPEIPWENPTPAQQDAFYSALVRNPLVIAVLLIGAAFVAACVSVLWAMSEPRVPGEGRLDTLLGNSDEGSLERGVLHALRDPVGLLAGAIAAVFLFFALFTTLFTNLDGIASSTVATDGTLLYWLGQHDVRRGSQPWFYFITETLQYEWLAVSLGLAGIAVIGWRLTRTWLGRRPASPRLLFSTLVAFWSVFLFLILSWAGEKMPWLNMHFLLPAILAGSIVANDAIEGAIARRRATADTHRHAGWLLVGAFLVVAVGWWLLATRLTYSAPLAVIDGERPGGLSQTARESWWRLSLFPLAALILAGAGAIVLGVRRTAHCVLVAAFAAMALYQVHAGFRLAYLDGDVARDTLIYNTTSPDVTRMRDDLTGVSLLAFGDDRLSIGYDSCARWPLNWYFRDSPGVRSVTDEALDDPAALPDAIIGVPGDWDPGRDCYMPEEIDGYTSFTYILRWHEPESAVYRDFAIAPELEPEDSAWGRAANPHGPRAIVSSVWSSVTNVADPEGQQRLFRLLMFREIPAGLNGYEVKLYIRDDLLPYYNDVRYGA